MIHRRKLKKEVKKRNRGMQLFICDKILKKRRGTTSLNKSYCRKIRDYI